jgi:SPP1 family predicted phage head-tail adaptor
MRTGRLRHRLRFQRKVETQTSSGAVIISWEDFATVWGELSPLSGREFLAAQQEQAEVVARATIRSIDGLDATMRMIYGGKAYDIAAILPDPTFRRHVTLMLRQGVSDTDVVSETVYLQTEAGDSLVTETGDLLVA